MNNTNVNANHSLDGLGNLGWFDREIRQNRQGNLIWKTLNETCLETRPLEVLPDILPAENSKRYILIPKIYFLHKTYDETWDEKYSLMKNGTSNEKKYDKKETKTVYKNKASNEKYDKNAVIWKIWF